MDKPTLAELADIIAPITPPAAPPPYAWIAFGVALGVVALLGLGYFLWRRSRHRRAALAQLKRAQHALQQHQLGPRNAAFQAALALRRAYRTAPQGDAANEWTNFLGALDQARYAEQSPSTQDSVQLLERARHWIVRAPC